MKKEIVMNSKMFLPLALAAILIVLPQYVVADVNSPEQNSDWQLNSQGWSIHDHMSAAQAEVEIVQSLESRVRQMDARIANLENKPYFDPKGIEKSVLKILSGKLQGEMNILNEEIAWHYRQADQAKVVD